MSSHLVLECCAFRYPGADPVFADLSNTFEPGSVTALTGPSGSGKSTLLFLLGLLLRPTEGKLFLNNTDLSGLNDRERSRLRAGSIGFVFQNSELDPHRTILDSVMEPGLYNAQPRATLINRGLSLLESLDLAHLSGRKPGQVSGGQAQRVALCRAQINDPQVIIADEPTGNLDTANGEKVLQTLQRMAHEDGRIVIVATHSQSLVERCDQELAL